MSSSLILRNKKNISWFDCDVWQKVGFIWQLVTTSSVAGPRSSSKALPKAKLAPKKGHGHCSVVCCPTDPLHFLNPSDTITPEKYAQQIEEMQWKLPCLKLALVNRMGPVAHGTTNASEVERNGLQKFCLICHIHHVTSCQPSTTSSSISTTFCRENVSTTSRRQKMLSKSSLNPETRVFTIQQETYFSLAKMCWL